MNMRKRRYFVNDADGLPRYLLDQPSLTQLSIRWRLLLHLKCNSVSSACQNMEFVLDDEDAIMVKKTIKMGMSEMIRE